MQNQPHSMRRKNDCQKEKGKEQQNKTEKSASVYSCPVNYYRAFSWMDRAESCRRKWMEYWGFLHNSDDMVSDTEQSETSSGDDSSGGPEQWQKEGAPYIDVELLTPNEYSRPQIPIERVNYIAIHYTANPGATAIANRNYFENLANTHDTKVSSHFVVGLDGEVVQCIPTSEMSYATNSRNVDTISIECCHPDETGQFNDSTYDSVVKLTAWLCVRFGLTSENVIRHYDVTGKDCPKYYVENPDAWLQMKADIAAQINVDYGLQG